MGKKSKLVYAQDIMSLYFDVDMISRFRTDIRFSNIGHEEDVILKPCLEKHRANMDTSNEPSTPYFYLHPHVIHNQRVLVPFTYFEVDF